MNGRLQLPHSSTKHYSGLSLSPLKRSSFRSRVISAIIAGMEEECAINILFGLEGVGRATRNGTNGSKSTSLAKPRAAMRQPTAEFIFPKRLFSVSATHHSMILLLLREKFFLLVRIYGPRIYFSSEKKKDSKEQMAIFLGAFH